MRPCSSPIVTTIFVLAACCLTVSVAFGQGIEQDVDLEFRAQNPTGSQPGDTIPSPLCTGGLAQIFEGEFKTFDTDVPYVVTFPALGNRAAGATIFQPTFTAQWTPSEDRLVDLANAGIYLDSDAFQTTIGGFPAVVFQIANAITSWSKLQPAIGPNPYILVYSVVTTVLINVGPQTRINVSWTCMDQRTVNSGNTNRQIGTIPLGNVIPNTARRTAQNTWLADLVNHVRIRRKQ